MQTPYKAARFSLSFLPPFPNQNQNQLAAMTASTSLLRSLSTHQNYGVDFYDDFIFTTVTHKAHVVESWIEEIERIHRRRLNKLIVGLDVEWRPSFTRDERNPVAILQLCVGRRCLIFQLLYADRFPQVLMDFLNDEDYTFVGVGIHADLQKLEGDYGFVVYNAVDLREWAADVLNQDWLENAGLKALVREVLDREIEKPKSITLSCWDAEWLSVPQVQYACLDAFLSFDVGRYLQSFE